MLHHSIKAIVVFALIGCLGMGMVANAQERVGLRKLAEKRKVNFGTAAPIDLLRSNADNGLFTPTAAAEFTVIEPENDFKPPAVWNGPGNYNFSNLDWLLGAPGKTGWAQANKVKVRGHVLVYARDDGYTLPDWIRKAEKDISPAQAKQYLHDYIYAVVGRYKGKVFAWDVVNEAIADGPTKNPYNLRDSFWFRKLGVDFIKLAFQYAHEADPKAELYINEYGAEGMGRKSDAILNLLKWLKSEKVLVTGAGMQYHLSVSSRVNPGDDYYKNAQRLKDAGFAFQITELDVSLPVSDSGTGFVPANPADLQAQADVYRGVLQLALDSPNCRGFQVWGFTDRHSWIPGFTPGKGAALILDSEYKPKPAYNSLKELLQNGSALETKAEHDARMKWWREAKFGMFIHWGVYSVPAGYYQNKPVGGLGEWIMNDARIPVADYRQFAPQFTAAKYDPDAWVRLAKEAGMKYIVITSKHHDGFALFDTKASDWNVVKASPYGKDLLKPLAAACKKYGMKLGFYYSQAQDWTNPGGGAYKPKWDTAQEGGFDRYLDNVAIPQMKEILSNYGPISVLWFDTPAEMTPARAARVLPILKLQPGIIVNNRLGGGFKGDTETPEQTIPATGYPGRDWETCMTLNNTWGFKKDDNNWKSSETLIRNLVDIASKGGNYLLNVGPTPEGLIPEPSIERLKAVGKWMTINGEAIYDTGASPFKSLPWGRCTVKKSGPDTTLYLHVFQWPADSNLTIPGLKNRVVSARLLGGKGDLKTTASADGVTVQVPAVAPNTISSTIVLQIAGTPNIEPVRIKQDAQGQITLSANQAVLHGGSLATERKDGKDNLGYWTDADDWADWSVTVSRPGRFRVVAELAAPKATAVTLRIADQTLRGAVTPTGDYDTFQKIELGAIEIKAAGNVRIELRPVTENWQPLNLRSVQLIPIP